MQNCIARVGVAGLLAFGASTATFAQLAPLPHEAGASLLASHVLYSKKAGHLTVTSPAFKTYTDVPFKNTQYRDNIFPGLSWTAGPKGTKSYALIMQDADGLMNGKPVLHWTLFNIPAATTNLPVGLKELPAGANYGPDYWGAAHSYMGPETPAGPKHRYHIQIFALDTTVSSDPKANYATLLTQMKGHVLAAGQIIGLGTVDPEAAEKKK